MDDGDARPTYHRVLLKLSGEAFAPASGSGISDASTGLIARQLAEVVDIGIQPAVVVGGGNIWRGRQAPGIERNRADYMGMLATIMNALALQDALEKIHVPTRVQSAIAMTQVAEPFLPLRADPSPREGPGRDLRGRARRPVLLHRHLRGAARARDRRGRTPQGHEGGTALYTADPLDSTQRPTRIEALSYSDFLREGYRVMDTTAVSLCMENKLPILVFNLRDEGNIRRVVIGEPIGTTIH